MVIEMLTEGRPLSEKVPEVDHDMQIQVHRSNVYTTFLDSERPIKYMAADTFESPDGLLFAMLFMQEPDRSKVAAAYVRQRYSSAHPMFSLFMSVLGQGDKLMEDEFVMGDVTKRWRVQVAVMLKHIDLLSS
jgi:hypothetical protein